MSYTTVSAGADNKYNIDKLIFILNFLKTAYEYIYIMCMYVYMLNKQLQ